MLVLLGAAVGVGAVGAVGLAPVGVGVAVARSSGAPA